MRHKTKRSRTVIVLDKYLVPAMIFLGKALQKMGLVVGNRTWALFCSNKSENTNMVTLTTILSPKTRFRALWKLSWAKKWASKTFEDYSKSRKEHLGSFKTVLNLEMKICVLFRLFYARKSASWHLKDYSELRKEGVAQNSGPCTLKTILSLKTIIWALWKPSWASRHFKDYAEPWIEDLGTGTSMGLWNKHLGTQNTILS